jgi:D-alanine-D-alanine ligase
VVEIFPEGGFYDYRHKYTKGHTRYQVPADLSGDVAAEAARLGELAFVALGCAGVARVDFRLSPAGRLYCLEVNTVPGMTETSLVPMAAKATGMGYEALVERLVELARKR